MTSNETPAKKNIGLIAPDILLPNRSTDMYKWATVACDQYTSDPEYWNDVENIIKDSDSTYDLMLPEIYLEYEDADKRIETINKRMKEYLDGGFFDVYKESFILTRRSTPYSPVRTGLVAALDLEQYDFRNGSKSLIRATEGTVTERIPPRMKIRKNAAFEMPHIMILIDDPDKTVIEPAAKAMLRNGAMQPVYDTDLMKNGGHISGYVINKNTASDVFDGIFYALDKLYDKSEGFLYAVGDGNHSLASAKCHYEDLKRAGLPCTNARYAMVEIVNLHDDGIIFEPIHRVLFGADADDVVYFAGKFASNYANSDSSVHEIPYITKNGSGTLSLPTSMHMLECGALQMILDAYINENPGCRIDYIHGDDSVSNLVTASADIGFLLPAMGKDMLFPTVEDKGALPRKTFSMGEAPEKRYYIECRIIIDN